MTAQTLVIPGFPRPEIARALSPNGRVHWAAKRKARLHVVDMVTAYALKSGLQRMQGHVVMQPVFTYPDHRKRDDDNLATGVMKAARDCLVKGGWLEADDMEHLRQLPPEVRVEKGCRSLEIRLENSD